MKRSLIEYRKKRRFSRSPEPAPGRARLDSRHQKIFVIHKHAARALHYDLRLEIEGALASWAVPKGPSYDPSTKRLAVEVEDHPIEYADFEGHIPDGEYGAGDSIVWDQGVYDTVPPGQERDQRRKGRMTLALAGKKLVGSWHLVRTRPVGGKQQWLMFKAKDGYERPERDIVAERPESVVTGKRVLRGPMKSAARRARGNPDPKRLLQTVWPPMKTVLSDLQDTPAGQFHYEVKLDGYRALAALSQGRVELQTRNALDLSGRFPQVFQPLRHIHVDQAVLDGEIVALDDDGVSRFEKLMMPGIEHRYVIFDLLWLDGEDLRRRPIEERRALLEKLLEKVKLPVAVVERLPGSAERALAAAKKRGLEGVIAKRVGSTYQGKRSSDWLKLKLAATQELAILGYTAISTGAKEIGALLVGVHEDDGFHYAGKVGTGYSVQMRRKLRSMLEPLQLAVSAAVDAPRMTKATWVKPKYVAEVAFTEWTSGGKLRHPRFRGLRVDKSPEECVRESR